MGRPGVSAEQIAEVIRELDAAGREVTVTAVRERLGSGSFTTIGAALNEWRREQAQAIRPAVPDPPEALLPLWRQLWSEAWRTADAHNEPVRQAAAREQAAQERARQEMTREIERLESEAAELQREAAATREALGQQGQEQEAQRLEFAKTTAAVTHLQAEVERLRGEAQKSLETVTLWIERATKAELKLQELTSSPAPAGAGKPGSSRHDRVES